MGALSGTDGIVFMESEAQKEDVPLQRFLESKRKQPAQ